MCSCQDGAQDADGQEEGPSSLLPGLLDWGAEGGRELQNPLAVCKQINQQINFSDVQLFVLSNPAVLPVCCFHFAVVLGKECDSTSIPGPAREQPSEAGEHREGGRAGRQAGCSGNLCICSQGAKEGKSWACVRVCLHVCLCVHLCLLCLCVCASLYVCLCLCLLRCICVCVCVCGSVYGVWGEMGRGWVWRVRER